MTIFLCPCWVGRLPVTVHMDILIMETSWWVIPFGDLDWLILIADIDYIEPIGAAVGIIIIWNRVEFGICQFVID